MGLKEVVSGGYLDKPTTPCLHICATVARAREVSDRSRSIVPAMRPRRQYQTKALTLLYCAETRRFGRLVLNIETSTLQSRLSNGPTGSFEWCKYYRLTRNVRGIDLIKHPDVASLSCFEAESRTGAPMIICKTIRYNLGTFSVLWQHRDVV